jgi:cold-inducible RNA-binding protein
VVEALNDYDYNGRPLRVNASQPKESRPGGGGGGYGYKGGGGGGSGYKGGVGGW